jgi:peptidoglycan/xylan/chitin deacetylase (PgdA/CDA1 family)
MSHPLLKSTAAAVIGLTGGARILSSTTNAFVQSGAPVIEMRTVPDGSGESLLCMTSAVNTLAGIDLNIVAVTRSGLIHMLVYLDDFLDSSNIPATTSAFNNVQAQFIIDNDGTVDTASYKYEVMLKRGWNHVVLSRAHRDAPTRNGSATVGPTVGGVSGEAHINGGSASFSASMWDGNVSRVRVRIPGQGATEKTRVFFKEIADGGLYNSFTCNIFDDGTEDTYTIVFPIMRSMGLRGTAAIISSLVGTPGYMTWDQIRELRDAGWAIINHTHTHQLAATMAGYTVAQCRAEIAQCRDAIITNGCAVNGSEHYFVAPFGGFLRQDAVNYRTALTLEGIYASFGTTNQCTGGHLLDKQFIARMEMNTYNDVTGYPITEMVRQYESSVRNGMSPMLMLHRALNSISEPDGTPNNVQMLASEMRTLFERQMRLEEGEFTEVVNVTEAIPEMFTTDRMIAA